MVAYVDILVTAVPGFYDEGPRPVRLFRQFCAVPDRWNDPVAPECVGNMRLNGDLVGQRYHAPVPVLQLPPLNKFVK